MLIKTPLIKLNGPLANERVAAIAFGMLGLTWRPEEDVQDDEILFATLLASLHPDPTVKTMWAAATFHCDPKTPYASLKLIRRFFRRYPALKDRVILSVKGGMSLDLYSRIGFSALSQPNGSLMALQEDMKRIRQELGSDEDGHELDIFEMVRVDLKLPPEEWMSNLLQCQNLRLCRSVAISEVSARTLTKAANVGPIAYVESEYSLMERSIESNGLLQLCKTLQIPIMAYSPLAQGLLASSITNEQDLPRGDWRHYEDRYSGATLEKNAIKAASIVSEISKEQNCTPAQLALAWLHHQWPQGILPVPGTRVADRAMRNRDALQSVLLDEVLERKLRSLAEVHAIEGGRYNQPSRDSGLLFADQ